MKMDSLGRKMAIKTRIKEAAEDEARRRLGDDQFRVNKPAVKVITESFKQGIAWFQSDKRRKSINKPAVIAGIDRRKVAVIVGLLVLSVAGRAQSLADSVRRYRDSSDKYFDLAHYYSTIETDSNARYCQEKSTGYQRISDCYDDILAPLRRRLYIAEEKKRIETKWGVVIP
jgi:hypothetical protein